MILRRGIYAQYQEQGKDALSFDRTYSDGVNLGLNFVTGARSVSLWVKPKYTTYNGMPREFMMAQYGGSGQRTLYMDFRDGIISIYFSLTTSGNLNGIISSNSGQYFNGGQWYHVCFTIESAGSTKLYVDGVQQTQTWVNTLPLSRSGAYCYWGKFGPYAPTLLGSSIMKELAVWTVERTPSEVVADMTRVYTGSESGLKAYFPTNEGSGNTIQDINSVYTGNIVTTNTTPNYIDDVMWVNS